MSDIGSNLPVKVEVIETKAMLLKWIAGRKQESKSRIAHFRQSIEDIVKGKIPQIEREILAAEQELQQLQAREKQILASTDTQAVENK